MRNKLLPKLIIVFLLGFYLGGTYVHWSITGTPLPTQISSSNFVMPEIAKGTLAEVQEVLEGVKYHKFEGNYNCYDTAHYAIRQLNMAGYPAAFASVWLETGPSHEIIEVPTIDKGYVLIEPLANIIVRPQAGGIYMGSKVLLVTITQHNYVDIDRWEKNPVFSVWEVTE